MKSGALSVAVALLVTTVMASPALAVPPVEPTTSLQPAWALTPSGSEGPIVWARSPGLFTSPDSSRVYSALSRRSFTGRWCDDIVPGTASVVQGIDSRTGVVLSTITPDIPNGAPVAQITMDEGGQRLVVVAGPCSGAVWNTLNVATGTSLARWQIPLKKVPLQLTMGPDPSTVYLVDWVGGFDGTTVNDYEYRVQALNDLTGEVRWTTTVGLGPWGDFTTDPTRQYQSKRLAVSADGSRIYVIPSTSSEVVVLDANSGSVVGRIALPASKDLRSIVVSPVSPRAFVTDWTNNVIRVIDTDSLSLASQFNVPGRCLESMDINATGDLLAVLAACDNPRTILMRTSDGSTITEAPAPADGSEIRLLPNGSGLITRRSAELTGSTITETLPAAKPSGHARPIPAPTQPRSVQVSTATSSARVSWSPPANAKRAKVTRYRVIARPSGQGCLVKLNSFSCTVNNLATGRRYAFTVEARNAAGWGLRALSPVVTLTQPAPSVPAPAPQPPKPIQPLT